MNQLQQLVLREAPCGTCPARAICHERHSELGCSPDFATAERYEFMLYASSPDFMARVTEVNGFEFNTAARPQQIAHLPPYIPRVRKWSRITSLKGIPAVAIPLSEVLPLASVSTIAMDLQTVDTESEWREILRDVDYFHGILPRPVTCFFSGVCQATRVLELRRIWPEAVLSNFGPYFAASLSRRSQAFHESVAQYNALMQGLGPGEALRQLDKGAHLEPVYPNVQEIPSQTGDPVPTISQLSLFPGEPYEPRGGSRGRAA